MSRSKSAPYARERRATPARGHRVFETGRLVAAGLLTAAMACTESTAPTRVLTPETAALAAGGNQRVKVKTFQLSVNTLRVDGPAVTGAASIGNSGPAIPSGVSIQAVVQQGAAARQAANAPIECTGAPGDVGKLPTGNCDVTISAQASNSSPGSGTLVPGPAVVVLRVIQTVSGTDTELASKSVNVNLVAAPSITSVSLAATTLFLDAAATTYTAVLNNPANSLQGIFLQAWIRQGLTRRNAVGYVVLCGGGGGVFPPGTCTASNPVQATSLGQGGGTLVPGPAVFELELSQNTGGATTTFDTKTIAIVLVTTGTPSIGDVTLQSTTLLIGGPSVDYTAQLQNPGLAETDILLQGELEQDQAGGKVLKGAGGTYVNCGSGLGVLPTGTCDVPISVTASGDAVGGALVPGPARFVLHLYKTPPNLPPIEFDVRVIDVTLVSGTPSIVSITPASNDVVIDGPITTTTVVLANPGPSLSPTVLLQGWIRQGTSRRAAGGGVLSCGNPFGALPNGGCTQPSVISANNSQSQGTGTLVPGNATFELELKHITGGVETILDTESIPITLVSGTPSIVSITPASQYVVLDQIGAVNRFTAIISNPGAALSTVLTQGYIRQGTALRGAGGANVTCGVEPPLSGILPNGECVEDRPISAFNANGGNGLLEPGPATFELELIHFDGTTSTILDTESIPIILVAGGIPSIVSIDLASTTFVIGGPRISYTATLYNSTGDPMTGMGVQGWIDQLSQQTAQPAGGVTLSCTGTLGEMPEGPCLVSFTAGAENMPGTIPLVPGEASFRLEIRRNGLLVWTKTVPITLIDP